MEVESGKSARVLSFNGVEPTIHPSAFTCHGAVILGDVHIGEDSSIWYNVVIRGDVNRIRIGSRTNVQDLSMLHVTHKKCELHIGNEVTIGHMAMLHGCTVRDRVLIGMHATLLDRAVINSNSIVAAGTLIREGFTVPEGVLVAGVPGKIIRDLKPEEIDFLPRSAQNYINYVAEYRNQSK